MTLATKTKAPVFSTEKLQLLDIVSMPLTVFDFKRILLGEKVRIVKTQLSEYVPVVKKENGQALIARTDVIPINQSLKLLQRVIPTPVILTTKDGYSILVSAGYGVTFNHLEAVPSRSGRFAIGAVLSMKNANVPETWVIPPEIEDCVLRAEIVATGSAGIISRRIHEIKLHAEATAAELGISAHPKLVITPN